MLENVIIEPMTADFILWRCLHGGPLSRETIEEWPGNEAESWATHRALNVPLLEKLIETYGTCAMLARDGDQVVGFLRFYPKAIFSMEQAGQLCLQQGHPAGPSERLVEERFPLLEELDDKTLTVHCLMTGSPFQEENPYQRKGLGTWMARELIRWAGERGWEAIEATAYADVGIIYEITGQAGVRFWERLGFRRVRTEEAGFRGEFAETVRAQAAERDIDPDDALKKHTMRLNLS